MKVPGIDHIHILVPDLTKAIAVAEALIGGQSSTPYGGPDWNAWASYHNLGGLDMFQPIDMDKPMFGYVKEEIGVYILAFRVDDIDQAVADVTNLGMPVVSRIGSEEAGFGKQMLQAQLERRFGTQMELVERGLPDDPLHCPIPDYLDHIEVFVSDIDSATEFFTTLTGHPYPAPRIDTRRQARSSTNDLGVRLTAPTHPESPVAQRVSTAGEGVGAIGIVTGNLTQGIETAAGLGLHLTDRYRPGAADVAEFDPADFFGISIRLVQRRAR